MIRVVAPHAGLACLLALSALACGSAEGLDGAGGTGAGFGGGSSSGSTGGGPLTGCQEEPCGDSEVATQLSSAANQASACNESLFEAALELPAGTSRSMAGASLARAMLLDLSAPENQPKARVAPPLPPPSMLVAEHFLAYYALPVGSDTSLGASLDLSAAPMLEFDFGVPSEARLPISVVVLLDQSQSAASTLGLQLEAIHALARGLGHDPKQGDAFVVFGWSGEVIPLASKAEEAIALTAESIKSSTGGDLALALETGIDKALASPERSHLVLFTDGGASASGKTIQIIEEARSKGRFSLSIAQFGKWVVSNPTAPAELQTVNADLLRKVAEAGGGGQHFFADTVSIRRSFEDRFGLSMASSASDARLSLILPPELSSLLPEGAGTVAGADLPAGTINSVFLPVGLACSDFVLGLTFQPLSVSLVSDKVNQGPFEFTGPELLSKGPRAPSLFNAAVLGTTRALRSMTSVDNDLAQGQIAAASTNFGCATQAAKPACTSLREMAEMLDAIQPSL